jgi:hypothetical protein
MKYYEFLVMSDSEIGIHRAKDMLDKCYHSVDTTDIIENEDREE